MNELLEMSIWEFWGYATALSIWVVGVGFTTFKTMLKFWPLKPMNVVHYIAKVNGEWNIVKTDNMLDDDNDDPTEKLDSKDHAYRKEESIHAGTVH